MSSNVLTYDDSPPHRPALSELGGGTKTNHPTKPPDPVTMITAEDFNQLSEQAAAAGRCLPLAVLTVAFAGGVPSITDAKVLGANVATGDFNVVLNGTGDTTIWWHTGVGGKLPATSGSPVVSQADDTEIDRIRAFYTTFNDSGTSRPAVEVKTKLGAVATNANFVVQIF